MNPAADIRKRFLDETKKRVTIEYGEKELSLIRATQALEELDQSFNKIFEHCKEWYHAFFPELERTVNDPELFLKLVYEIGAKKNFSEKKVQECVQDTELQKKIVLAANQSMGAPETDSALRELRLLALNALNLKEQRKALETFLENELQTQSPNFAKLAGTLIAAKMVAKAGSFKRLSQMPSSTLQLLGAETALFRHLKSKRRARPPKYGFLFAHPLVKQLIPQHKGKMARFLAGKLSIAAKTDVFENKTQITEILQNQVQKRFEQLQKQPFKAKNRTALDSRKYEPKAFSEKPFHTKPFSQRPAHGKPTGAKPFYKNRSFSFKKHRKKDR